MNSDGTANTIKSSLQEFITDKGLPVSKMVGLGTDAGADRNFSMVGSWQ